MATRTSDSRRDGASAADGCQITSCPRHRPLCLPRGLHSKTFQGQQGQLRPEDGEQDTLPRSSSPGPQRPPQGDQDVHLRAIVGYPTLSSDAACQPWSTSQPAEHLRLRPQWRWQWGCETNSPSTGLWSLLTKQEGEQGSRVTPGTPRVGRPGARAPKWLQVLLGKTKHTLKHLQDQYLVSPHLWS